MAGCDETFKLSLVANLKAPDAIINDVTEDNRPKTSKKAPEDLNAGSQGNTAGSTTYQGHPQDAGELISAGSYNQKVYNPGPDVSLKYPEDSLVRYAYFVCSGGHPLEPCSPSDRYTYCIKCDKSVCRLCGGDRKGHGDEDSCARARVRRRDKVEKASSAARRCIERENDWRGGMRRLSAGDRISEGFGLDGAVLSVR